MKKLVIVLASAVFVTACVGLFGCKSERDASSASIVINSFDTYKEAQRAHYRCMVGDVDMVDDERGGKYVSVDIFHSVPAQWEYTTSIVYTPRIVFQSEDAVLGYNLRDISSVTSFSVEAKNENNHDATLMFWISNADDVILYNYSVPLPKNEKITAVFPIDTTRIGDNNENCSRFILGIIDPYTNDENVKTVYSFDNFIAHTSGSKTVAKTKAISGDTILSFTNSGDLSFVNDSNIEQLGALSVPAGASDFVTDTPIGDAMELKWYGKPLLESTDWSCFPDTAFYVQMYGVKLNEKLFAQLDLTRIQNGEKITLEAYNPNPSVSQTVYLVLADQANIFVNASIKLSPLTKGKVVLDNVSGLNLSKLTGLYILYDTYKHAEHSSIYVNNLRFE